MLSDYELIDNLHSEPLTHPSDFNINTFHKKIKKISKSEFKKFKKFLLSKSTFTVKLLTIL
jgi:hypothetical protein